MPCGNVKWNSRTAPASSSSDDSPMSGSGECARSIVATVVIEESPAPSPQSTPPSTRHKSYSSVSSIGRKLVEKLADEVVEDFMELEMGLNGSDVPTCTQDKNNDPESESRIRHDNQDLDVPQTSGVRRNVADVVDSNKVALSQQTDLIDSAWEARNSTGKNFDEKRAFFEELNQERQDQQQQQQQRVPSERGEAVEHQDHERVGLRDSPDSSSGSPQPTLRSRGDNVLSVNKPLSRVTGGFSWVIDPVVHPQQHQTTTSQQQQPKQHQQPSASPVIIQNDLFSEGAKRKGGHQHHHQQQETQQQQQHQETRTCVVRKVFHASNLALEGDSESSDGSVISVEIMSVPRHGHDEARSHGHALEWFLPLITDKKQID